VALGISAWSGLPTFKVLGLSPNTPNLRGTHFKLRSALPLRLIQHPHRTDGNALLGYLVTVHYIRGNAGC
jgi:hypothetical protein